MEDAATNYFFPAIAEKFPQLIERHWKDRFHYAEEPGTKSVRKTPAARVRKSPVTPLEAVVRGFALGAAVLAALYFGQRMIPGWMGRRSAEVASAQRPSLVKSSSNLVLTKPVELQFASGKVTLPVGTAVKLVSRDGASLKVNYLNTVIVVPASSTDIDSAIPESGASSSGSPPSATPAPTHSGES
jgi:hypothetical protein